MLGGVTGDSGYATAVGGEIGKRAVEYNDFYDTPMGSMTEFEQIELIAKNYFNGDEEKALAFLLAYRKAEGQGIKDGVIDSIDSIIHLDETVKNLAYAAEHYDETIDKITLTANEWNELLSYAMENDPALSGEKGFQAVLKSMEL